MGGGASSLLFLLIYILGFNFLIKLGPVGYVSYQFKQHLEPTKMTYSSNHLPKRDLI